MLSNTIATIPNYYTYAAFKTGFTDGLGAYNNKCRKLQGPKESAFLKRGSKKTGDSQKGLKCDRREERGRKGKEVGVKGVKGDSNNNKYMSPCQVVDFCDWFDAYSVNTPLEHNSKGIYKHTASRQSKVTSGFVDDYNDEIEELLSESLRSRSQPENSSLTQKCVSPTLWRPRGGSERFKYSTHKGCIDWLESCDCPLEHDLARSFGSGFEFRNKESCGKGDTRCSEFNSKGAEYLGLKEEGNQGMHPACGHLQRKLATDNSSCEDVCTVNSGELGETTLDEEVFEEELYYLGPPTKVSTYSMPCSYLLSTLL